MHMLRLLPRKLVTIDNREGAHFLIPLPTMDITIDFFPQFDIILFFWITSEVEIIVSMGY